MGSALVISEVIHDPWSTMVGGSAHHRSERAPHDASLHTVSEPHRSRNTQDVPGYSEAGTSTSVGTAHPTSHQQDVKEDPPPSTSSRQPSGPGSPTLGPSRDVPAAQSRDPPPEAASSSSSPQTSESSQPVTSIGASAPSSPNRIKIRDLRHIQSFVLDDASHLGLSRPPSRSGQDSQEAGPQYEISSMPVGDIIEMVAGLLTKITTTNDKQHEHLHRHIPPLDGSSPMSQQTQSILAFHGKNVPSITIMSYLSRIHKYCPTTYDVFISLLVYFDRITERVNSGRMQSMRQASQLSLEKIVSKSDLSSRASGGPSSATPTRPVVASTPPTSVENTPAQRGSETRGGQELPSPPLSDSDPHSLSNFFAVDSFNIHRLVIAGVTCASKFFSDIFYTNSRYAKVGGLPLVELNHLELQFLLLNDFRLQITPEDLEAYGTMLVEFYAREVYAQNQHEAMEGVESGDA